ncbi:CE1759 family FMN reductase [Rothia sp. LK2588]|uniref:CE1759 family FMN reductase n=1 Tax=Rothia sp. LK2588 TaxID=3114369 RepID=UPI0034CE75A0
MQTPQIVVISAGLSVPSSTALLADQLSEATVAAAQAHPGLDGVEVTHLQLRELATGITNYFLTGFPVGDLAQALDAVREADAIIAVTPTFKAGYSGLFKSFWDVVDEDAMHGKPVLLAATGGTARHSLMIDTAMRPLFSYLKMQIVPTGVFAATDDFGHDTGLQHRIDAAAGQLVQMLGWSAGTAGATFTASVDNADAATDSGAEVTDPTAGGASGVASDPVEDDVERAGANSGHFFGVAVEPTAEDKGTKKGVSTGLPPLQVTPFEQLLNS